MNPLGVSILNKKDIANFRRQLKLNNDLLKIQDIFSVYITKNSREIYHQQNFPFELLEVEQQELFLESFKKVLSGQLGEKLFVLKFQPGIEQSSQDILYDALQCEDAEAWRDRMLQMVEKMLRDREYEQDIVVNFIRGEQLKPTKKREEYEESDRDMVYSQPFIMCSIHKTQDPKRELLFDYVEKEFKYQIIVDPIINLNAPLSGFLFPCLTNDAIDVNRVLYATGKKFELDVYFMKDVLNVEDATTAEDDKIIFEEVVKQVTGDQISTSTLSNLYEEIYHFIEESEDEDDTEAPTLDYKDVAKVLHNSGVEADTNAMAQAFKSVVDDPTYEIKAYHIVPKPSAKSIKIKTKVADLSVSPTELRHVRQVELNGKLYLMIELEENTVIEGFEMLPEKLFTKGDEAK